MKKNNVESCCCFLKVSIRVTIGKKGRKRLDYLSVDRQVLRLKAIHIPGDPKGGYHQGPEAKGGGEDKDEPPRASIRGETCEPENDRWGKTVNPEDNRHPRIGEKKEKILRGKK